MNLAKKYVVMQVGQDTSAQPVKLGEHEDYPSAVKLAACCQLALGMDISVYIEEVFEGQDGPIPNRFKLSMNPWGEKCSKQNSGISKLRHFKKRQKSTKI
jgi:hypothetical protein